MKILIADDDALNRKLLADVLGAREHKLLLAEDGRQAVDCAKAEHPDLILLDLRMPVMDGFEALELLKADSETASIPVWVVTADAMPEILAKAKDAGSDQYITKPLNIVEIVKRIDAISPRQGTE